MKLTTTACQDHGCNKPCTVCDMRHMYSLQWPTKVTSGSTRYRSLSTSMSFNADGSSLQRTTNAAAMSESTYAASPMSLHTARRCAATWGSSNMKAHECKPHSLLQERLSPPNASAKPRQVNRNERWQQVACCQSSPNAPTSQNTEAGCYTQPLNAPNFMLYTRTFPVLALDR